MFQTCSSDGPARDTRLINDTKRTRLDDSKRAVLRDCNSVDEGPGGAEAANAEATRGRSEGAAGAEGNERRGEDLIGHQHLRSPSRGIALLF